MELINNPEKILDAIGLMAKRGRHKQLVELLELAKPSIELVTPNYGADFFVHNLSIPFEEFLATKEDLENYKRILDEYLFELRNSFPEDELPGALFKPDLGIIPGWRSGDRPLQASNNDVSRIWKDGYFRLFVSHSTKDKVFAASLRQALLIARIDCFVAHEAIRVTKDWQREIQLALASCHALFYLASPNSNKSVWCQQELGWSLGRGTLTYSYAYQSNPIGFAGAEQALKVPSKKIGTICNQLTETFMRDERTERAFLEPLLTTFESSKKIEAAEHWLNYLEMASMLNEDQLSRLSSYKSNNVFSQKSPKFKSRIEVLLSKFGFSETPSKTYAEDEYDPFADE